MRRIKVLHVEPTDVCQAACPMCARETDTQFRKEVKHHLRMEQIQQHFSDRVIGNLDKMFMCGNYGDPAAGYYTLDIYNYFRKINPEIVLGMNTNGAVQSTFFWHALGRLFDQPQDYCVFSIDGLEDTNHVYRKNVNWAKLMSNVQAYIAAGGSAHWDMLVYKHNQHQVDEAEELSQTMGFEKFVAKKTGRFITTTSAAKEKHQAVNRNGEQTAELKKPDAKYQNAALTKQDALLEKYGSMDAYYDVVPIRCKVKDEGSLFITAEGLAMPCCWTAGRMYKWWQRDPKVEQIWKFIDAAGGKDAVNVKKQGLKAVFETGIFDAIEASWNKSSCGDGKLKVCSMKCGVEFDPFAEQFK